MNVVKKLRVKFVVVFMAAMLAGAVVISSVVYFKQRSDLEYQCMVYLLDIHNYDNQDSGPARSLTGYPPYFVLEIDNQTDTAEVVLGDFFLADQGLTVDALKERMAGTLQETDVLEEYQVRYFNGVRHEGTHRITFIDVSYIDNTLQKLLGRIFLFVLPSLGALLVLAVLLSRWFSAPAQRAIDEQTRFISKVSHELKTPLSIISANIDLIDGGIGGSPGDLEFGCDNIRHECQRMNGLIEAMLWAALPSRKAAAERVDLSTLLRRELLRFEVVAYDSGLTLQEEIDDGLTVTGDETQLSRLVDILVENAVKYCSPGGTIRLTARREKHSVRLVCANTGEEIPKERRDNLFRPFYQADSSRPGAGLGLAIAHEIVAAMGGDIQLECADGWNRFTVRL